MRFLKSMALMFFAAAVVGSVSRTRAHAERKEGAALKVWLAVEQRCDGREGRLLYPRFLIARDKNVHFPVVIENVSEKPVQLWAEGNPEGDYSLTFQITDAEGKTGIVRPGVRAYTRSALSTVRLEPGEKYVREVSYHADSPSDWQGFPSPASGKSVKVTLRAVFEQPLAPDSKNPELWAGKVMSLPQEIVFQR